MRKSAASPSPHEHVFGDEWLDVGLRRAPRIWRFLVVGIGAGVIAAIAFTIYAESSGTGAALFGLEGVFRVLAVSLLIFVALGLAVAGMVVLVVERVSGRRARTSLVDRETVIYHDLSRPVSDDPPHRGR